jgi:hypothetical protein
MKRLTLYTLLVPIFSIVLPPACFGQSDDFNDGDDAGWVRYDPLGGVGAGAQTSWSFTNGGYRIRSGRHPAIPASAGPARGGAYHTNDYTDFYLSADIVNWDETLDQAIGLLARMTQLGLGTTDGYALTYQVPDHDIDITRFTDEGAVETTSIPLTPTDDIQMIPGRSYRYVWIGKADQFTVRVYELPNLTTPILECTGTDSVYTHGVCGFLVYDNTSAGNIGADATFDNYFALDVEPPKLVAEKGFFDDIIVSWPDTPGFVLQGTPDLSTSPVGWTDITEGIVLVEGRKQLITTSQAGGNRFFRLRRP